MSARALAPRIFLVPHDRRDEPAPSLPDGAIVLPTLPTRAFGDGSHATTALCARVLDDELRRARARGRPVRAVLDVGTGTGVLARLARAHGVPRVVGTDIDAGALAAARAHAALDEGAPIELRDAPPDHWGAVFDVVVANILEEVLRALAPALARALAPGGRLVVSGFTAVQRPAIAVRFAGEGLAVRAQVEREGWLAVILSRGDP